MKERAKLPFDEKYFREEEKLKGKVSYNEKFRFIHKNNFWSGGNSVSGQGSDKTQTAKIVQALPGIIEEYNVASMLDIPCGDFNWMRDVDLSNVEYTGADIVHEIIDKNMAEYSSDKREFRVLGIMCDKLPGVDLIFCRDCLVHFCNDDVMKSIENIKKSKIKFMASTTFSECHKNDDIVTGDWRVINLEKAPFNFPSPLILINENCTEGDGTYSDKSIGLWRVSDL